MDTSEIIYIREFTNIDRTERFTLPECASDIAICKDDLLLKKSSNDRNRTVWQCDPEFRVITRNGQAHRLGPKQSAALRHLWQGYVDGEPWMHGKSMLSAAGSNSFHVPDLFKRSPIWKELVERDGHGMYRLSDDLIEAIGHHRRI